VEEMKGRRNGWAKGDFRTVGGPTTASPSTPDTWERDGEGTKGKWARRKERNFEGTQI